MYAIVRTGGRQYHAEVGATIDVEKLPFEENQTIELADVLLIGNDASTLIGQPLVEGATVKATVVKQFRGPKIIVFRYHQRRTHKRKTGHRQYYTRLRIDEIVVP